MTGSDVQERFGPAMTDKAPREEREWEEVCRREDAFAPLCGSRFQDVDGGKAYPPADAFEHLWDEARHGEETIANIDTLPADRAAFVMALLHLLLLRRSRTRTDTQR